MLENSWHVWEMYRCFFPTVICFGLLALTGNAQHFVDVSTSVGIKNNVVDPLRIAGGIVTLDYNNDGLYDIYLPSGAYDHKLYKNEGGLRFRDVTAESKLEAVITKSVGGNAADINNDGWDDLFITTREGYSIKVLVNNQDGTFSDMTKAYGFDVGNYFSSSLTFADFNSDGILDVYVGNYANYSFEEGYPRLVAPYPNQLFLSQNGYFWSEVAADMGLTGEGYTLAVFAMDLDLDQDMDIYVGNDFGTLGGNEGNLYYQNNGDGEFQEKSASIGLGIRMFAMGTAIGDFDGDQDLDVFLPDVEKNSFMENRNGIFTDVTNHFSMTSEYVSWSPVFFDSKNSGANDLFVVNGQVLGVDEQPLQFYEFYKGMYLENSLKGFEPPFYGRGLVAVDFDLDGDLDIAIHSVAEHETEQPALLKVLRNTCEQRYGKNGFLDVKLEGTTSNRNAFGAILKLHLNDGRTLLKTMDNGGGYMSGGPNTVHFGINTLSIERLEVIWPSGVNKSYKNIPAKSRILINEDTGVEILSGGSVLGVKENSDRSIYIAVKDAWLTMFDVPINQRIQAKLVSLTGKEWDISFTSTTNKYTISLKDYFLSEGIYVLSLHYGDRNQRLKVSIRR